MKYQILATKFTVNANQDTLDLDVKVVQQVFMGNLKNKVTTANRANVLETSIPTNQGHVILSRENA